MRTRSLSRTLWLVLAGSLSLIAVDVAAAEESPPPPTRIERPRVQPVQPTAPAQTLQPARPGVPITPAKPPPSAQTGTSVDVVTVVKAQLHQCEQDLIQCDSEGDALRSQVQTLKTQIGMQQIQISQLQAKLDETVHPGGSLVKAWCDDDGVSHNTAGQSQDCGTYGCEPVSGLCRIVCDSAAQCHAPIQNADGTWTSFVCDTMSRLCINANANQ